MKKEELQALYKKGEYDKILALTALESEGEGLLYHLASLLSLGKETEALAYIEKYRAPLFTLNPRKVLEANFSLRISRKEWEEAKKDYDRFMDLPYQSQAVEEALRVIPKALEDAKKASEEPKEKSLSEIRQILKEGKGSEIIETLHSLKKEDFPAFEKEILALLIDPSKNLQTRAYALLYLKSVGYEKEVRYLGAEKEETYLPSALPIPFFSEPFKKGVLTLEGMKDQTLARTAKRLAEMLEILLYPESPFLGEKEDILALSLLAEDYLEESTLPLSLSSDLDLAKAKQRKERYLSLLNAIPPID